MNVRMDTDDTRTEFDTVISVYSLDDPCSPAEYACDDDGESSESCSPSRTGPSCLEFTAESGQRYLIVVEAFSDSGERTGTFFLKLDYN